MQNIFKAFTSQLSNYLNPETKINPRTTHNAFFMEIKKKNGKKLLIAQLQQSQTSPYKLIRLYTVVHIIMLYHTDILSEIEQHLIYHSSKDPWMNTYVLQPYFMYLKRCCSNVQIYQKIQHFIPNQIQELFQVLFFSINNLRQLFSVVAKMPFLGRYYQSVAGQVCNSFVEIIAVQAQRIYNAFKISLAAILNNPTKYFNPQFQNIVREILRGDLLTINQQMKKLFLDKYFYPLGKGIGVKLFRLEEQSPQLTLMIDRILSNHVDTERRRERAEMESNLFPSHDCINIKYFEETLLKVSLNMNFGHREEEVEDLEGEREGKMALPDTNTEMYEKII